MVKFGHTSSGKQRWHCGQCTHTLRRTRHDTRDRHERQRFIRWLIGTAPAALHARASGITLRGFHKRSERYWAGAPNVPRWISPSSIIVLDGTVLRPHQCSALIAYAIGDTVQLAWHFTERETAAAWSRLLSRIPAPRFAVCDGQKGLSNALRAQWPETLVQRCLIHVVRQSLAWITQRPQTKAGQQLRALVCGVLLVRTRRQRRRWVHRFWHWHRRYAQFLAARTRHPVDAQRWWHTHRRLRHVRTLIERSLPHLFTFVRYPEVPRTSNHVEGGINARLHELFRTHRGLSVAKKRVLTAYFLLSKLEKNQHESSINSHFGWGF